MKREFLDVEDLCLLSSWPVRELKLTSFSGWKGKSFSSNNIIIMTLWYLYNYTYYVPHMCFGWPQVVSRLLPVVPCQVREREVTGFSISPAGEPLRCSICPPPPLLPLLHVAQLRTGWPNGSAPSGQRSLSEQRQSLAAAGSWSAPYRQCSQSAGSVCTSFMWRGGLLWL